jgi:hypothetical protein
MFEQLQSRVPNFQARLTETIVWCVGQPLESNPRESAEIQERRELAKEAGQLVRRAFLSAKWEFQKTDLYQRGKALLDRANPGGIKPPLARQLRSALLQPKPFVYPQTREERAQIVDDLSEKRAQQLRLEQRYPRAFTRDLQRGRLLLYAPDENLADGAAQYSSKGFFNWDNQPPWDTWICFHEQYLVSWVPPQLLELAKIGIEVNPEECISWAPEVGLPA